jgi:ligand-binding SRPBCC domain-containing protein
MFIVRESAVVHSPIERIFLLSTRIELVRETLGMHTIDTGVEGGLTAGHVVANSRVVWSGWKFGLPTRHHTLITGFIAPHEKHTRFGDRELSAEAFFQDTQERGRFAFFQHDHHFYEFVDPVSGAPVTELRDEVRFELPFGPLGRIAARLLLTPHIRTLCRKRFARLQALAEGDGWRAFTPAESPTHP